MGNKNSTFGKVNDPSDPRPGYYKTNKYVYYKGEIMENVNPMDFKTLKYSYGKTSNFVYFKGNIIVGADPKTFKVLNRNSQFNNSNYVIGMDKNHSYKFGVILE